MSETGSYDTIQQFWQGLLPPDRADQPCLYTRYKERFRPCSYKDLNAQAHCAASFLMDRGLLKGQTVGFLSPPHLSAIVFDLALQFVGAIGIHLPASLTSEEIEQLAHKHQFQFLFVGDHSTYSYHKEFTNLKPSLKGLFLETEDAEGLSPEKLITFDIMVLRGKVIWREQMELINDVKASVSSSDTYAMFPKSPEQETEMAPILYQKVLSDLSEAKQSLQPNGNEVNILATTSNDRYLHHIFGTFAPIANHRPLYLISPDSLNAEITASIKPGQLVGTPSDIEKMYQMLPENFLGKAGETDLNKAQELIDIREEAAQAGKKPPFLKNVKYRTHNLRLYKQVRKKLGGQLTRIVCDYQEPDHKISRFIRECGIDIQVME